MRNSLRTVLVALVLLAAGVIAEAQQAMNVPAIGFLRLTAPSTPRLEAFRHGLRELGYIDGQNIAIKYRYAEGRNDRLPDLAAELVRLKVKVIVAVGQAAVNAAKAATQTIPIVMVASGDPVDSGLIASLARPGENLTGLSIIDPEMAGKHMELLKETAPRIRRVAFFHDQAIHSPSLKQAEV